MIATIQKLNKGWRIKDDAEETVYLTDDDIDYIIEAVKTIRALAEYEAKEIEELKALHRWTKGIATPAE